MLAWTFDFIGPYFLWSHPLINIDDDLKLKLHVQLYILEVILLLIIRLLMVNDAKLITCRLLGYLSRFLFTSDHRADKQSI